LIFLLKSPTDSYFSSFLWASFLASFVSCFGCDLSFLVAASFFGDYLGLAFLFAGALVAFAVTLGLLVN